MWPDLMGCREERVDLRLFLFFSQWVGAFQTLGGSSCADTERLYIAWVFWLVVRAQNLKISYLISGISRQIFSNTASCDWCTSPKGRLLLVSWLFSFLSEVHQGHNCNLGFGPVFVLLSIFTHKYSEFKECDFSCE